jgi:molybdopterin-guanine dinucleotide biosynthesis protein
MGRVRSPATFKQGTSQVKGTPVLRRSHRIAVIRHHYHVGFAFDLPSRDSWRVAQAGVDYAIV